jgi:hypothetical protein
MGATAFDGCCCVRSLRAFPTIIVASPAAPSGA